MNELTLEQVVQLKKSIDAITTFGAVKCELFQDIEDAYLDMHYKLFKALYDDTLAKVDEHTKNMLEVLLDNYGWFELPDMLYEINKFFTTEVTDDGMEILNKRLFDKA